MGKEETAKHEGDVGEVALSNSAGETSAAASLAEYKKVVEKYKALIDSPRDDKGKLIEEIFHERIEALFDKNFVSYADGETVTNLCDFKEELINLCNYPNTEFKIFRYKQVAPGVMDSYFRLSTDEEEFVVSGRSYFRNAMVYKSEATRTMYKKVSGQYTADKDKRMTMKQTEREFGCRIHELPSLVRGKLLGETSHMLPVEEKYEFLRIIMEYDDSEHQKQAAKVPLFMGKMLTLFRYNHVLRLKDSKEKPYVGGAYFRYSKKALGSERMYLFNGKNDPVAFCEKTGKESYTIYGTRSLLDKEFKHKYSEPKFEDVGSDSCNVVAFYPWFQVNLANTAAGRLHFVSVLTFDVLASKTVGTEKIGFPANAVNDIREDSSRRGLNVDFEPLFNVSEAQSESKKSWAVCDYYESSDHLAVIKVNSTEGKSHGHYYSHNSNNTDKAKGSRRIQVDVAPGVDPALILCIAACLEMTL
ncbi:hypothetical protein ACA910_003016 [Epithemia clementina (nom. ined.)]